MDLIEIKNNFETGAKDNALSVVLSGKQGRKWEVNEFFETGEKEIREVIDYLKLLNINLGKQKVLDFGCGVGRLTQALVPYFSECAGVDISENMIKKADEFNKYGKKCRYIVNTADNLKMFPDNYFDFVYSNITLQHISPPYSFNYIKEFLRVIKPGGVILFQVPSKRIRRPGENEVVFLLKNLVLKATPEKIVNFYKKKRWGFAVNMYPIKKQRMVGFVKENGGKIINIIENNWGGKRHDSLRYCLTK